jgi:hypothetical protein
MQPWSRHEHIRVMEECNATLELPPHHTKNFGFSFQNHFVDSSHAFWPLKDELLNIPTWSEISWRSSESLHFEGIYCLLFVADWPTIEIQQISSNCVQKICINFVRKVVVNAQMRHRTKWWRWYLSYGQNSGPT